jgi:hypothetical protein
MPELFDNEAWRSFQAAFRSLRLFEVIKQRQVEFAGEPWLSKISIDEAIGGPSGDWQTLVGQYLGAYANLVQHADTLNHQPTQFAARYPFSLAIWETQAELRFVGALVSPFHPLRLAWLSSVLDTFRNSGLKLRTKNMLLGAVAGWQFPASSATPMGNATLLAQPMDDGPESLFVGWSLLVPISSDARRMVEAPRRVLGEDVPALASGGLTAKAAEESIATYFDINPFVSTVVVDLAASQSSARLESLDEGVIRALRFWRKGRTGKGLSPGGIQVLDSIRRHGTVPSNASTLGEVDGERVGVFSWRRYEPDPREPGASDDANIRVLSDSGMNLMADNQGPAYGAVGPAILRRVELSEWLEADRMVRISPGLAAPDSYHGGLEQAFVDALSRCERRPPVADSGWGNRFTVEMADGALGRADWVVAGDSGVPPIALSKMLQRAEGQPTLWEWNAPLFGARWKRTDGQIAQRPYVVVAEPNPMFLGRVKDLVQRISPEGVDDTSIDDILNRILRRLGAHGLGVSALFANNKLSSPQIGAIGFWLAFELLDRLKLDGWTLLLVPIDKVEGILDALGGSRSDDDPDQRGDLLLMAVAERSVRLVPVEVKCTGVLRPAADFDNPNAPAADSLLARGIGQAQAEQRRLGAFARKISDKASRERPADATLLRSALVSLLDIGSRLSTEPLTSESARLRISRVIATLANAAVPADVDVMTPIVLSFEEQIGPDRVRFMTTPNQRVAVYQVNPSAVVASLDISGNEIDRKLATMCNAVFSAGEASMQRAPRVSVAEIAVADEPSRLGESPTMAAAAANPSLTLPVTKVTQPATSPSRSESADDTTRGALTDVSASRGLVFSVGTDVDDGSVVEFWPGNTRLSNMHVGVFGESGTGKTQLCLSLLYKLHLASHQSQGEPLRGLVLDPKNDYGREERAAFQSAIGARVLNPRDLPLDVIGIKPEMDDVDVANRVQSFVDLVSGAIGRGVGQVQRTRLYDAIRAQVQVLRRSPTVREICDAYRTAVGRNRLDTVSGLLDELVRNRVFVEDHLLFTPLADMLAKQLLILNLKPLQPSQNVLRQVMAIAVSQYFDAMLTLSPARFRDDANGVQLRDLQSVLLIDEANVVMRQNLMKLDDTLLQGREFGVSVIISSQFPNHFFDNDVEYASKLRTWFMHRVPILSSADLRRLGIARNVERLSQRVLELQPFHSLFASGFEAPRIIRDQPLHEILPADG